MKKGLFQSKAFSLLLIVALIFCMAPQFAFTAYADESNDFTSNVGVKTGPVEDGYTYYAYVHDPDNPNADPYGYVTVESKADLYTLTVPYGTQEVTLDFGETETISYNYTEDGTFLEGTYPDPTVGETTTTKKVDSNNDGIPDYIRVQTPYDSAWNSTLLYAITFKYGDVIGKEEIEDVYEMLVAKAAQLMSKDDSASFNVGDWFIFDQARDGRDVNPHYLESAKAYIEQHEGDLVGSGNYYSNYAKAIIVLTALGADPRTFTDYDLFEPLADMNNVTAQGMNGAIWALLALDSHDYNVPIVEGVEDADLATRDALYEYLADAYLDEGVWALRGTTPDVDITAMTIAALAPYYEENEEIHDKIDQAIKWLLNHQNEDGTFSALNPDGSTTPTAESTAMVVIALTSLGIDPATDSRFIKNGNSVMTGLCSFAVLEGNNLGMKHIANGPVNTFATEQGYRAFVSYMRFQEEKRPIYDLLDQMILTRVYGQTRYETSLEVAERYMKNNFLTELDSVVIATGDDFPDALSGSSLSIMNEAPVILISNKVQKSRDDATAFIKENLAEGGNVFIIGGESVVSKEYADSLTGLGYEVTRYAGNSRYDTNLQILNAVGESDYLLVCSGLNYADAATASATALPVLLVGKKLEASQLEYLESAGKKEIYVIGGTGAVAEDIANALAEYDTDGTIQRVAGDDRALTAKAVAEEFFDLKPYVSTVVFAYGGNFPDCISGGLLAYTLDAPILYGGAHQTYTNSAAPYVQNNIVKTAYILGGPTLISDEFVFGLDK